MSTIEERVRAGMAWLDQVKPGWDRQIDLDTLNLGECNACVVGQLAGAEHEYGIMALTGDPGRFEGDTHPAELGFDLTLHQSDTAANFIRPYKNLTAEWVRQIKARRAALGAST